MSLTTLILRYSGFAVLAVAANLLAQRLCLGSGLGYWPALMVGTAVGLVVKYVLDKRWIFADFSTGAAAHGRKFSRYTLMGVATTVIFWGAETGAYWIWHSDFARETGAVIGLAIGYVVKYNLDRRFVFPKAALS